jgi:hypothetical protein
MQNNSFFKRILFVFVTVLLLVSCDKDFNEIGSDIIGEDHFGLEQDSTKGITAYNIDFGSVESSNLPINALGYYNHPFFGKTKASFVSQIVLDTINPSFGTNPTVTKVELSLPYFSTLISTDAQTGNRTYELDSIYGSSKIKLSVYESNYYLRDYSASSSFQEIQKYFSGDKNDFDTYKNPSRLNNDDSVNQNDEFLFSPDEIRTYKTVDGAQVVDTRSVPGMRLNLRNDFFQNKLFGSSASGQLKNNTIFKEYFRGLYFKAENASSAPDQGSLALLDFKKGKIVVTYTVNVTDDAGAVTTKERQFSLSLSGNTVNVFENNYTSNYTSGLANSDMNLGDEKLYLKGGQGSMTVIDLFKKEDLKGYDAQGNLIGANGVSDELDDLRNPADGKKWLINESSLTFWIDKTAMAGGAEPNRIYLYDLNNHRPLIDYYYDNSVSSNAKDNKYVHDGIIKKETTGDKRGIKYRIRLTKHIQNLIYHDSTNVKLGLVVTESIGAINSAKLKNPFSSGNLSLDRVPFSSVMNPLGTVIFGSNPNVPVDKRLKLKIYYTKPN